MNVNILLCMLDKGMWLYIKEPTIDDCWLIEFISQLLIYVAQLLLNYDLYLAYIIYSIL